MSKIFLGALLMMADAYSRPINPEPEIKTDKEGVKSYLLKQHKLAENNKISKRKLKKNKSHRR